MQHAESQRDKLGLCGKAQKAAGTAIDRQYGGRRRLAGRGNRGKPRWPRASRARAGNDRDIRVVPSRHAADCTCSTCVALSGGAERREPPVHGGIEQGSARAPAAAGPAPGTRAAPFGDQAGDVLPRRQRVGRVARRLTPGAKRRSQSRARPGTAGQASQQATSIRQSNSRPGIHLPRRILCAGSTLRHAQHEAIMFLEQTIKPHPGPVDGWARPISGISRQHIPFRRSGYTAADSRGNRNEWDGDRR